MHGPFGPQTLMHYLYIFVLWTSKSHTDCLRSSTRPCSSSTPMPSLSSSSPTSGLWLLRKDTGKPMGATSLTHTHMPQGSYPWHGSNGSMAGTAVMWPITDHHNVTAPQLWRTSCPPPMSSGLHSCILPPSHTFPSLTHASLALTHMSPPTTTGSWPHHMPPYHHCHLRPHLPPTPCLVACPPPPSHVTATPYVPLSRSTLASITQSNTMRAYPTSGIKLQQTPLMVFNSMHCLIILSSMALMLISAAYSSSTSSFGCIDNFPHPPTTIPTKPSTSTFINSTAQLVHPSSYPPMPL